MDNLHEFLVNCSFEITLTEPKFQELIVVLLFYIIVNCSILVYKLIDCKGLTCLVEGQNNLFFHVWIINLDRGVKLIVKWSLFLTI